VLRIEVIADGQRTTLWLSGRIQPEHLPELQTQIDHCSMAPRLDLGQVRACQK
jgi:hypothetical protein